MNLADQLATKRIVVFLGTGGVGKTTIAAASALQAAESGRRTLVLTVDPARRLADSLGVKLGAEPTEIQPNLHAMMLDTKAALDELIARYAPNAETLQRVLRSRFYDQLSDAFAGSEEFVSMGALHDLYADDEYDLVVVDTPPSKHAVDFLSVNKKLIRVFESGVVKYLFKPTRFLRLGGGYMAGALAKWTSQQYVEEVSEFMLTFDQMFLDMEDRVRLMDRVITDRRLTGVNLVTVAETENVQAAARLFREITEDVGLPVSACIANRHYPRLEGVDAVRELVEGAPRRAAAVGLLADVAEARAENAAAFLDDAVASVRFYESLAAAHERGLDALRATVDAPIVRVPALAGSVHDLASLDAVRRHLFANGSSTSA